MNGLSVKKISEEVYVATDAIVRFGSEAVAFIRQCALVSKRGRARICAHKENGDTLHEMLIAITRSSYIHPHRHHRKVESFHLIDGVADIVIFSEQGTIFDVVSLGPSDNFYYRLDQPYYHTLIVKSEVLVIHEITNGPFDPEQTDYAMFSPLEGASDADAYMASLGAAVEKWKALQ
jgi:cupin fold WbuC family metalloprotein